MPLVVVGWPKSGNESPETNELTDDSRSAPFGHIVGGSNLVGKIRKSKYELVIYWVVPHDSPSLLTGV